MKRCGIGDRATHGGAAKPFAVGLAAQLLGLTLFLMAASAVRAAPSFSISPHTVEFGSQPVGVRSAARTFTLQNTGDVALTITTLNLSGVRGEFSGFINCRTIFPGQTCLGYVSFTPVATGSRVAVLTILTQIAGVTSTVTFSGTGTGASPPPPPGLTVTPGTLDFGNQPVGTMSAARTFTLTNTGTVPVTLFSASLNGAATDFSGFISCGMIAPGQSCQGSIFFRPTAAGTRTSVLSIFHSGTPNPVTVTLTGNGVGQPPPPTPVLVVSPTTVEFGEQTVGVRSSARTFNITNQGPVAVTITSLTLEGVRGDYSGFISCRTIFPGQTCQGVINFTPAAQGRRIAVLSIFTTASATPVMVTFAGTGVPVGPVPVPAITLEPANLSFGNQNVGTTSAPQTILVRNTGTAPLTGITVTPASGNTAEFSVNASNCAAGSIAPGAACAIHVVFTPAATGTRSATFTVSSNAGPATLSVTGTGVQTPTPTPVAILEPTSLSFGEQETGSSSSAQTITIRNIGTAPLTNIAVSGTSGNTGDFSVNLGTCAAASLAPGGTCQISVVFTPTATGSRSATFTVTSNAASVTFTASGTGTSPSGPMLVVSPNPANFGEQEAGTPSGVLQVLMTNTGTSPLPWTDVVPTSGDTGDFALTDFDAVCQLDAIPPDQSCGLSFRFTPGAEGSRTAVWTIITDIGNFSLILTCTGVAGGG